MWRMVEGEPGETKTQVGNFEEQCLEYMGRKGNSVGEEEDCVVMWVGWSCTPQGEFERLRKFGEEAV